MGVTLQPLQAWRKRRYDVMRGPAKVLLIPRTKEEVMRLKNLYDGVEEVI